MNDLVNSIQQNLSSPTPFNWNTSTNGMSAFIITMINDNASTVGARKLIASIKETNSFIDPFILPATTPDTLDKHLETYNKKISDYKWPKIPGESLSSLSTGMILNAYGAKDFRKVVSCLVSHMRVWQISARFDVPLIVFEHDAILTKQLSKNIFDKLLGDHNNFGIIGLNDPRGATRKSNEYLEKVLRTSNTNTLKVNAPWIDDKRIPQGIAGNSAYIISPHGAKKLFEIIDSVNLWPNDALMCKQLMGNMLYQAYPFYTRLQGIKSTTQG